MHVYLVYILSSFFYLFRRPVEIPSRPEIPKSRPAVSRYAFSPLQDNNFINVSVRSTGGPDVEYD